MAASTDQRQVIPLAHRLRGLGAERGAFQVLVNAAAQRQAADRRDLTQHTPFGRLPLRERPEPHLTAANDKHPTTSEQPGGTVA